MRKLITVYKEEFCELIWKYMCEEAGADIKCDKIRYEVDLSRSIYEMDGQKYSCKY